MLGRPGEAEPGVLSAVVAVLLATSAPVSIVGGVSPDGAFEVVLEADHDTPRFDAYELKGGDEQFPAFLVRKRKGSAILGRFPWPGAASEREALLRDRTQIMWRSDSAAVAINTRDTHYANSLVLALDPASGVVSRLPVPPYADLTGRPDPPPEKLRSRGRDIAIHWTAAGLLVFETWRWGDASYPLSYRVSLRLTQGRLVVVDREPIADGRPAW